jgi:hypothetical protein
MDHRREELESRTGGDHDLPYEFMLPTSMPQVRAWVTLLVAPPAGDYQQDVVAGSSAGSAR